MTALGGALGFVLCGCGLCGWSGGGGASGICGDECGGISASRTQGYLGVDIRDVSDEEVGALKLKEARGAR